MKKVAFYCNHLGIAGSEIATYDYAYYNQTLLGNESIIIARVHPEYDDPGVIEKFSKQFQVIRHSGDFSEVDPIIKANNVDVFYALKAGNNDGIYSKEAKSCIHATFGHFEPHGNVYAYVSEWLTKAASHGIQPFVPHMVDLPDTDEDMRKELNIPKDAIVFGRYGSYKEFSIQFVKDVIKRLVQENKNIYFLFANTEPFFEHPQIIYLDPIWDLTEKTKFINTTDAYLHARQRGETFGLACGEWSIKNKPVITFGNSPEKNHTEILGAKGLYYFGGGDLHNLLKNFTPQPNKDWDAYTLKYSPKPVMDKFKQVFL